MSMIKALWSSDHHTLHPHTPTRHTLSCMDKFYYKDNNPKEIKLSVFGGDVFHDLASANDPNMILVQRWFKKYNHICHENKTYARYLEGTSSHDWGQPELLEISKPKGSPYVKYINTLCIEYFPDLDINVLYVPDNFGKVNTETIYELALEELAKHNLTQVDFIFLHGGFKFQLPPIADKHGTLYDELKWSKLAKHAIFSGHIHKPARKLNIHCSGSFNRTAYGEMHPKGAYRFSFNKEKFFAEFWDNKDAQIYDYIDVTPETTTKELIKILNKYLEKKPPVRTHIKVRNGEGSVVVPLLNEYKEQFPDYVFESDNVKKENVNIDETLYDPEEYAGVQLTKENLKDNLYRFIKNQLGDSVNLFEQYDKELLDELLDEAMND
ncbi:hypothetical protein [Aeromonas phage AerS_266]|nr:hypothetical protein [Aeromonas phage AerS_266]